MVPLSTQTPASLPTSAAHRYVVGQDASGQWLAIDTAHRGGGFFKSRADAIHFAEFESGHRPDCVSVSPVPLRLEF